jgi:hypothetical protein
MRQETLPSPGILANGPRLLVEATKAISACEISAGLGAGKSTHAKKLSDFFTACATALATFVEAVVPTVTSRVIRNEPGKNKLWILHSEQLDPQFVPAPAAFAITSAAKTITKVEIDGPYVILTVSVAWAAGNTASVAYTQPGAGSNLRDLSGNLLANYTATAVTNSIV